MEKRKKASLVFRSGSNPEGSQKKKEKNWQLGEDLVNGTDWSVKQG